MNQQLKGIKCFDIVPKKLGFYDFFEKYCVFEKNFVVDYFHIEMILFIIR